MEGPLFNEKSWIVIVVYLIFTTILGHVLGKRQATLKDFFLGGRKLPWYAVSGSIIATELSAMTLVGAPAFLWAKTGNLSYAVLALGTILARVIVGYFIIPRYYEKEIYSPYEYIGNQLDERANRVTSFLFMIGGIMGQGTRVLLTAVVLQVVTGLDIYLAIWLVGLAALLWTCMGGIVTVVWTDVIQFCIFTVSAFLTLAIVVMRFESVDGQAGVAAIWSLAREAGKLEWFDADFDITKNYTIWAALIAGTIGGLAAYGTDQMMMQRCFCCRGPREARKAMIWSSAGQVLMLVCLFVGVALWAFYQKSGVPGVPNPEELRQINENANRLVPVFIKFRVPWFLGGLMVAGIFAAAISSLDSILAALSQQTLAAVGVRNDKSDKDNIRLSRFFIVVWAVVLCSMASLFHAGASQATLLIELALSVVGYVSGAILATFLIAAVPFLRRETKGLEWAAALSVMTVFAITRHGPWAPYALVLASAVLVVTAARSRMEEDRFVILKLYPFVVFIFFLNLFQYMNPKMEIVVMKIGWPWYTPLGCLVMLAASLTLCEEKLPKLVSR